MAVSESDQPYHLHPQDAQTNSVNSPNCHKHALQLRSPHAELSRPSSFSTVNESDNTSPRGFRKKCENGCDSAENISTSPELTEDVHASKFQADPRHTHKMSTSTLSSPKVLRNKKLERQTKDIVERNKITLGRNTSKCGSYLRGQEMPHHLKKVCIQTLYNVLNRLHLYMTTISQWEFGLWKVTVNSQIPLWWSYGGSLLKQVAITETNTRSCTSIDDDSWAAELL